MTDQADADTVTGAFHHLVVRFPALLRRVSVANNAVNLTFYVEDMAIECAQSLTLAGIGVTHRMDHPRVLSLSSSTWVEPGRLDQAVQVLDGFLRQFAPKKEERR